MCDWSLVFFSCAARTVASPEVVATTVITQAEILRARYEFLLKAQDGKQLQRAQHGLDNSVALLADFHVVPMD